MTTPTVTGTRSRMGPQFPAEFGNNMVYYYDDGNRVQMYSVEENLLKGYIKRQM